MEEVLILEDKETERLLTLLKNADITISEVRLKRGRIYHSKIEDGVRILKIKDKSFVCVNDTLKIFGFSERRIREKLNKQARLKRFICVDSVNGVGALKVFESGRGLLKALSPFSYNPIVFRLVEVLHRLPEEFQSLDDIFDKPLYFEKNHNPL